MKEPLNILAFRMSRKRVDDVDAETLGITDETPQPGYVYDGGCYICLNSSEEPYLVIYNQEWSGRTLHELEYILYTQFYLPEICGISAEDYYDRCRDAGLYEEEKRR